MVDSHTIHVSVDASSARSELNSLGQSIGSVSSALKGISASSGGSFDKLSRQLSGLSNAFDQLRSVSGLGNVSREIRDLSSAIGGIRAPNQRAVDGITNLANAARHLGGVRVNQQLATDLTTISAALSRVRVSEGAINNLQRLAAALTHLRVDSTVASGLAGISHALSNFRVSATATTNIERLATTLSRVRIDQNLSQGLSGLGQALSTIRVSGASSNNIQRLATALSQVRIDPNLAHGLSGVGQSLANLRGPTAGTVNNLQRLIQALGSGNVVAVSAMAHALGQLHNLNLRVPSPPSRQPPRPPSGGQGAGHGGGGVSMPGIPHLTGELRGLENAFSATYQAASLFRTAIGAITLGEFAHGIYEAGNDVMSFKIALDSVASDSGEAGRHFDYIKKTANELGGSLNQMIPAYQRLVASMRSLGYSEEEAQKTFRGAQAGLTANHAALIDQKRFMTELMETFAMGGGHATQVMRGMASHYPQLIGIMERVLKVNGEGLKKIFMEGGISAQGMIDIMQEVGRVSERGVAEALNHSMAQVNLFNNRFTEMKQKAFDGGFDSGLTTFLKETGKAMDSAGLGNLGEKLGEGFRTAFAGVTVFTNALIENRSTIYELLKAAVEIAVLYQVFKVASVGATILGATVTGVTVALGGASRAVIALAQMSNLSSLAAGFRAVGAAIAAAFAPSLALVAVIATITVVAGVLYAAWDDINKAFGDGGPLLTTLQDAVKGLFDWAVTGLNYFLKTAVGVGAFLKTLWKTDGDFGASKKAFDVAFASVGNDSADKWKTKIAASVSAGITAGSQTLDKVFDRLGGMFFKLGGSGDFKKIYDDMKPAELHAGDASDYEKKLAEDLKRAGERAEELNHKVEKLFDKFLPDIKAAKELAGELRQIDEIQKKINEGIHPKISGMEVSQDTLSRLKDAVKEKALEKFDPTAIKIRDKIDELRAYQDFMGKGNKNDWAVEKEIITEKLALKKKGLEMTNDEEQALRKLLALEKEMAKGGSDGFTQWTNSQKSAIDSMNDNIKSGMDSVADGIGRITTEGKGKFKSLGAAIRSELSGILRGIARNFINTGIRSLMADAIKGMDLGGVKNKLSDAIGSGDKAVASATSKLEEMLKNTATMEVQAGVVNINGASVNGLGSAASSAEKAFSGGAVSAAEQTIGKDSAATPAGLPLVGLAATAVKADSVDQGTKQLQALQAMSGIDSGSRAVAESTQPKVAQQSSSQIDQYFGKSTSSNDALIATPRAETPIANFSSGKVYTLPTQMNVPSKLEASSVLKDDAPLLASPGRHPNLANVDPRLTDLMRSANRYLPEGYTAKVNEGFNASGHAPGSQHHVAGRGAVDMQIFDQNKNPILNRGDDPTGLYTRYARGAYTDMLQKYPELKGKFAWGGAFGTVPGGNTQDLMHFDIGGERGHIAKNRLSNLGPLSKDELTKHNETIKSVNHSGSLRDYGMPSRNGITDGVSAASAKSREQEAWDFFKSKGRSDQDISKIMGNLKAESALEPNAIRYNDAGPGKHSEGLAQWNRQRRDDMRKSVSDEHGGVPYDSLSTDQRFKGQLGFVNKEIDSNKTYRNSLHTSRDAGSFGHVYEGYGSATEGLRTHYGNEYLSRFGRRDGSSNANTIDRQHDRTVGQSNGSLKPLSDSTQKVARDFERNMNAASNKFAPEFTKDLSGALKGGGAGFGNVGSAIDSKPAQDINQQSADASGSLLNLGGSIASLATQSKAAPGAIMGVAQSIMQLIQQLASSAGGAGGGGGGLFGAIGGLLGGLFEEGGISGSAVSSSTMPATFWAGAPHYAEGTPNTSGGMPAILHDNEAVIPLTRGREVPVQLNGAAGGGDTHNHFHMSQNIQAKDHDSFRRNTGQMSAEFHKTAARMHIRNN